MTHNIRTNPDSNDPTRASRPDPGEVVSNRLWIADRYILKAGTVRAAPSSPSRSRSYNPFSFPELPLEFAALSDGTENDVVGFVSKWGLLGYDFLPGPPPVDSTQSGVMPLITEEEETGWIISHAQVVETLLHILSARSEAIAKNDPQLLMEQLKHRLITVEDQQATPGFLGYISYFVGAQRTEYQKDIYNVPPDRIHSMANEAMAKIVNPNLASLRDMVFAEPDGSLTHSLTTPALLPVIYYHLADAYSGRITYLRCSYDKCMKCFLQKDSRQLYCPEPTGPKGESRCSIRARQAEYRKRTAISRMQNPSNSGG